tara:strand:+ start:2785 stop:2925 length:141 start_codon:yes stop_codon:yes gene_type:complete
MSKMAQHYEDTKYEREVQKLWNLETEVQRMKQDIEYLNIIIKQLRK